MSYLGYITVDMVIDTFLTNIVMIYFQSLGEHGKS
jgi:hypothetical protein